MNSDGVQTAKGWGANGLLQMSLKGGAIREGWGVIGLCKSGGVQDWAMFGSAIRPTCGWASIGLLHY